MVEFSPMLPFFLAVCCVTFQEKMDEEDTQSEKVAGFFLKLKILWLLPVIIIAC